MAHPDAVHRDRIDREERELSFATFAHDDAWRLGSTIREFAVERGLAVTIDVHLGEQQVFHAALTGTSADNDDWIARKIRTVRRFARPSMAIELDEGIDWLDGAVFARAGGCVPIRVNGAMVGTATVSGLSSIDDHDLVIEGLRALHD
ncbi:heme-binding protein [Salinibacterium sp. ZJ77]|uniref:heme-degrading domain-containing protein n=1 Tax=Salinibacterium sp. ZJ77 TaxID=2708337 RepID=UPI0014216F9A|nr:heme-binding protein [Salinibacterium sp. ZJ77]